MFMVRLRLCLMYPEKHYILWVYILSMILDVVLFIVCGTLYHIHFLAYSCISLHWALFLILLHDCLYWVGLADVVDNMVISYFHIYSTISVLLTSECHLLLLTLRVLNIASAWVLHLLRLRILTICFCNLVSCSHL